MGCQARNAPRPWRQIESTIQRRIAGHRHVVRVRIFSCQGEGIVLTACWRRGKTGDDNTVAASFIRPERPSRKGDWLASLSTDSTHAAARATPATPNKPFNRACLSPSSAGHRKSDLEPMRCRVNFQRLIVRQPSSTLQLERACMAGSF